HSSGITTVVTGVLKQSVDPEEHGIAVCGGKGKTSRQTPSEIKNNAEIFGLSTNKISNLQYTSKMSAKVDNAAIQAGYHLYHHTFFLAEGGEWAVIQQGMCTQDRTARRYHWLHGHAENLVIEPHDAIVGEVVRDRALDMTAKESEQCRKASLDLAKEPPSKVNRLFKSIRPAHQKSLEEWMPHILHKNWNEPEEEFLSMPRRINWRAIREVYQFQPQNYEQLLGFKGIGPATLRGLALISELIHGEKPSWRDPVKYSFAYGGKDGVPYPVNRRAMDKSIQILQQAIEEAKIGDKEKKRSLKRLRRFLPQQNT
ncbi:MAG: DUF763 domain-containing protein, partial [Thermoproteota archaeon]